VGIDRSSEPADSQGSDQGTVVALGSEDLPRVRRNEPPKTWYRGDRVFRSDGSWYFHTREGVDVGPFSCQFDAELEADMLITRLRQAPQERVHEIIRSHLLDVESGAGALNSPAFTDYLVESGGIELLRKESQQPSE
jgi:hypothetical protein